MSTKPQIELFLENESGTQQVAYPFVESDHVSLSNGMDIDTMIRQDVSMPTVTHEDLSFKVGVGDQDVSSAIVDSSVAEMTIKGKTYQNILPEPSTHVLTNNKEMFKVNEGLDPNVEIVDGVSKSAILKGKTLVNYFPEYTKTMTIGTGNWRTIFSSKLNISLTPNTSYLFINNSNVGKKINVSVLGETTAEKNVIANLTTNIVKFTTPDTTDNFPRMHVYLMEDNTSELTYDSFMVIPYQDDMENWDIPYFTGMQSVKMPVLTTTGKNLFDIEKVADINNWVLDKTTAERPYGYYEFSLKPNTTYTFSRKSNVRADEIYACFHTVYGVYSEHGGIIHPTNDKVNRTTVSFTTDSNGKIFLNGYGLRSNFSTFISLIEEAQIEEGSVATPYEPYKTNILSTPEDLELRGIGNVKDELNVATGEYTQAVYEYTFTGDEIWEIHGVNSGGYSYFYCYADQLPVNFDYGNGANVPVICDKLPTITYRDFDDRLKNVGINLTYGVRLNFSDCDSNNGATVKDLKAYLKANPTTIQYLISKSVKTVDLSSSGNWEKIVLNGSENWNDFDPNYGCAYTWLIGKAHGFSNVFAEGFSTVSNYANAPLTISGTPNNSAIWLSIGKSIATLDQFKHYLSQNPVAVWYQTTTHLDSTQVKQPIFFKDGHIQLSSGADNSLIPTLDYQAKTSNSYVMDLMKTGTTYTMKASGVSGTATIGNAGAFTLNTNRTFISPPDSLFDNKLLVVKGSATDLMIIEGDVTSKTIPYFKGIKSAFEDESKIEVLSTGKNLFDGEVELGALNVDGKPYGETNCVRSKNFIRVEPKKSYVFSNDLNYGIIRFEYDENYNHIVNATTNGVFTTQKNTHYIKFRTIIGSIENDTGVKVQLEKSQQKTTYEPYKSNNTKIPLLSPLRSLPNGVHDEIVLDRENNKAKIIQRVGAIQWCGNEKWTEDGRFEQVFRAYLYRPTYIPNAKDGVGGLCDSFNNYAWNSELANSTGSEEGIVNATNEVYLRIRKSRLPESSVSGLKQWLSQNPVMIQYELKTPVITEVDLEGFPYVYKDGHIFLNGEIIPVTEIKYSINQQHQIESSSQDLIRHQKEIDYLYKLIGEYVRVDYKNTLLSLNLELK